VTAWVLTLTGVVLFTGLMVVIVEDAITRGVHNADLIVGGLMFTAVVGIFLAAIE
jgi:hypothetical protein